MKELVCVHQAHTLNTVSVRFEDGKMIDTEERHFRCHRCDTSWKEGEKEPRVVLGRLE